VQLGPRRLGGAGHSTRMERVDRAHPVQVRDPRGCAGAPCPAAEVVTTNTAAMSHPDLRLLLAEVEWSSG